MLKGATRKPDFLAMNPNGKAPVLEIKPGTYLAESNAILCYLADGTRLMPAERLAKARVLQWLFFEQYSHEPYIAVARFLRKLHPDPVRPFLEVVDARQELISHGCCSFLPIASLLCL